MAMRIVVAGATGNLGKRIVKALKERGANVVALARAGTSEEKVEEFRTLGAEVAVVNMSDVGAVATACAGAECVVSALQGLQDVIVDAQTVLLQGAVQAGVPRFIPSDFSTDFRQQAAGENRNFDLRREFHKTLDKASIQSTAIFNGAFGEILTYNVPLLDFKKKIVGYWSDPDWHIDFTTMDDTAAFTAAAALEAAAPEARHIASFQVSPRELQRFTADVLGTRYELVRLGSVEELAAQNRQQRAAHPEGERELYPRWQQGQYMQSMFTVQHPALDNDRYPGLTWTSLAELIPSRS